MCRSTDNRSTKDRVAFKALSTNVKAAAPQSRKRTFRQRRVSFSSEENVKEISTSNTDSWYSKNDISSFKMQVKSFVLGQTSTEEEAFGMERYQFERRQQKKTALRHIVLSQQVKKDPEFQRYISRHQTATSKEMALNEALANFCDVYDPLSSLLDGGDDFFCNKDMEFNMAMIDQSC